MEKCRRGIPQKMKSLLIHGFGTSIYVEKRKLTVYNKLENKKELEKFAREEYTMKPENDEIYLIEYDTLAKK